jgi:hypothetical protein
MNITRPALTPLYLIGQFLGSCTGNMEHKFAPQPNPFPLPAKHAFTDRFHLYCENPSCAHEVMACDECYTALNNNLINQVCSNCNLTVCKQCIDICPCLNTDMYKLCCAPECRKLASCAIPNCCRRVCYHPQFSEDDKSSCVKCKSRFCYEHLLSRRNMCRDCDREKYGATPKRKLIEIKEEIKEKLKPVAPVTKKSTLEREMELAQFRQDLILSTLKEKYLSQTLSNNNNNNSIDEYFYYDNEDDFDWDAFT